MESVTGFPECLDGRVKTLHPRVHAGLLADLRLPQHGAQLEELEIRRFDLLVSNLYPFTRTVASGASVDECVEQIDIGGPAMVRAAAKNHPSVAVVTSVAAYPLIVEALGAGGFTLAQRRALAARAFADIAEYDVAVANWCAQTLTDGDVEWPAFTGLALTADRTLRYGENPHQQAALYTDPAAPAGLAQAQQLHGKEMSYNNYVDADAAWRAANDFSRTGGGDHQARQPVRNRDRRRRGAGAPQGARLRPGLGLRRRDRRQPAGLGGAGRPDRRDLHRGGGGPGLRRRRGRGARGQEEHPAAASARVAAGGGRVAPDQRRAAGAAGRPDRRRR